MSQFYFALFVVLCTTTVMQTAEDVCPKKCVCRSETIDERQAKSVTCIGTGSTKLSLNIAPSVEYLRFTHNSVRKVDFFVMRFPTLVALGLCCNGIHEISGSGRTLPKLRQLDLSVNNLHVIQQYVFRDFSELTMLNLSWNGLHSLSPEALNLPNLKELDLRHNRLTVLRADYFKHSPRLSVIQLAHNALATIPSLVFTHSLRLLQLSNNRIVRLDESAFEGINISGTFDLSDNALRKIPSHALKRLGHVDTLLLDSNELRELQSGAFVGISARVLSISKQKHLRFIQRDAFFNLPQLEALKLRENIGLTYIPHGAISSTPRLIELDLSGNSLLALEKEFISHSPSIVYLNVSNNKFLCHCTLQWLQNVKCLMQDTNEEIEISNSTSLNCTPYILNLFPDAVKVELGSNVSFQCRALAVPPAKITWISPSGMRLLNNVCNNRLCVNDHSLTVRFIRHTDQGIYACSARNPLGEISRSVKITVKDPNIQLYPVTVASTFVTLSWNISNFPSSSYILHCIGDSVSRSEPLYPGLRTHSYTVRDLNPGSMYTFSLRLEWDQDSIELCNLTIKTQPRDFLLSLGIQFNYFAAVIFIIFVATILLGCMIYCGIRCCIQQAPENTSTLRKAELFQSTSAHSDVAFITFIDIDVAESNLNIQSS